MKTNIIGVIIALALAFAGVICAWGQDNKVSEVRKVEAFSSIRITSVGTVYFTQSDSYSLQIEGREKYVKNTESTVKAISPSASRIRRCATKMTVSPSVSRLRT